MVSGGTSVNFDGNREREALTATALDHRNLLSNPKNWRWAKVKRGPRSKAIVLRCLINTPTPDDLVRLLLERVVLQVQTRLLSDKLRAIRSPKPPHRQ